MPFQFSTMTLDEEPIPTTKRPGAAEQRLAMLMAIKAGPRV